MGKFFNAQLIIFPLLLLLGATARAQSEKDSLESAFHRYQAKTPQEKLFVHLDKSFYLAGETIWFKIYSMDAGTNIPSSLSGVAYVELLDKEGKAVLQEKIALDSGIGNGYLRSTPAIPSGNYIFRAYTNWMKNFGPDLFYQQQLTIINTLMESGNRDTARHPEDNIRFFPEGGNLVNGITSVIAFKAVNAAGEGIACHGVVLDQRQDTITRFQSNSLGMGSFSMTPQNGNTYYARVQTPTSTLSEKLPAAYDQGYTMHLDRPDGKNLRITVSTSAAVSMPIVWLFGHTRSRVSVLQASTFNNNQASFSVNPDSLDEGITHFTILNTNRQPLADRLYCKPPRRQLQINASIKPAAATREKLLVDLSTATPLGRPATANLSMSVFLLDSLQAIPEENILNYCLLSSELRGHIESPAHYFAGDDPSTTADLDNLMLTQGWSRFRWEDILKDNPGYFEFQPETNGLLISGKIIDRRSNQPPPPGIVYLSVPGKPFLFAAAQNRSDGALFFHIPDFYGNKEVIVQANNQADSNLHIEIATPFYDRFSWQPASDPGVPKGAQHQLLYRSIAMQAENAYRVAEKHRLFPLPPGDTTGFYGHPDLLYNLDDYTRFVTMDEVIREFVQDVRVRRNGAAAFFRVRNDVFNLFFDDDPLLLIDGVPVFDGDKMMAMNPLKIEKIDVISHRYRFGPSLTDGVVSFVSYDGDLGGYSLPPTAVAVQYNGIQQHQEFYSPIHTPGAPGPLPDLRNQLLWSPDINMDSSGKKQLSLYTSDLRGKYALVVQGIGPDGLLGYSVTTFLVN